MRLRVKDMDIASGGILVAVVNQKDAEKLDLHHDDRIRLKKGKRQLTANINISESEKAVPEGKVGLFEEVLDKLKVEHDDTIDVDLTAKPKSVSYIRDKLHGKELGYKELYRIVDDIVHDRLTAIEKTYFVAAGFAEGFTIKEIVSLTKAMVDTGIKLNFRSKAYDKHSIGGVAGNRTTMLVVPICAAAGLKFPKTSSRSITSPAGTADTMETLCKVSLNAKRMKEVIHKTGACIIWGGAINLAPADDKIIHVESPLSIDAEGQLLASVMAKKASVGADRVLIDIPKGKSAKVKTQQNAVHLKEMFELLGKEMDMEVEVIITDGNQPIGKGIGPFLEARDVMWILENDKQGPADLKDKSLMMSGILLGMAGHKNGYVMAKKILESGKALKKMKEIIKAQGAVKKKCVLCKLHHDVKARKSGLINEINNGAISKVARIAGAPSDKEAGVYLHKKAGQRVKKGDVLYTIYSKSKFKLGMAKKLDKEMKPYSI
ncbi:MAG: AMP phosphorylase [Nanoarchaeota archaeon]|nr:AMP phosphorylase [Nanoarchaeota archaeon]